MALHPGIQFILVRVKPHSAAIALAITGELLAAATALAIPKFAGASVEALSANAFNTLSWSLVAVAAIILARLIVSAWSQHASQNVAHAVERTTRADFQAHLLALPIAEHQRLGSTRLVDAEYRDLHTIRDFVLAQPARLVGALATGIGALGFALAISWKLTALCALIAPPMFLLVRLIGRKIEALASRYWDQMFKANGLSVENIRNIALLKAFARESDRHQALDDALQDVVTLARKRSRLDAAIAPLTRTVEWFGVAGLAILTSRGLLDAELGINDFAQFVMYAFLLMEPVRTAATLAIQLRDQRGSLDRLGEILALPHEPQDGLDPGPLSGHIRFQNVGFTYPGRRPVLQNANLEIQPGDFIAMIGPNGGGKSTLMNLLTGMWPVDNGAIYLDQHPLPELALSAIRRQILVVSQHTELLDATIRTNLLFAKPDATEPELQRACHIALLEELIDTLPEGLETRVGDLGARLSGGQRQRLAIARAILADPTVLVLDEATSMFDPQSEAEFLRRAAPWFQKRTVLFITHREAPIAHASRLVKVEDGAIHELTP